MGLKGKKRALGDNQQRKKQLFYAMDVNTIVASSPQYGNLRLAGVAEQRTGSRDGWIGRRTFDTNFKYECLPAMNLPTCNMLLHSYGGRHTSSQFPEVAVELGRSSGGECTEIVLVSLATVKHQQSDTKNRFRRHVFLSFSFIFLLFLSFFFFLYT